MYDIRNIAKKSKIYSELIEKMTKKDKDNIGNSKKLAEEFPIIKRMIYSSIKYPVRLVEPMFEARVPFAVPNNYYQPIYLNDEKLSVMFRHNCMRSIFFVGNRLIVISKTSRHHETIDFFMSFLMLHFEKEEYRAKITNKGEIDISVNTEKTMKNLITGKIEKKKIRFNFIQKPIIGKILSKQEVVQSTRYKQVYSKYQGGIAKQSGSIDLYGYVVSVPHFAPHPYLLRIMDELGYTEKRDFQEHVVDYFREHI